MTLDLREHFSEFRGADPARIHLAAHSHHFWPDAACRGHRRALEDAARLADKKWETVLGVLMPRVQRGIAAVLALPDPATIAVAPNTHDFFRRLLSALPAGTTLRILTSDSEFYSFTRQVARLEEDGLVAVERIAAEPFASFPQRFASAARRGGHDLVYVSQVFFNSAAISGPLDDIAGAVGDNDALVVFDGYHGFMAVPTALTVSAGRAFYLAGGYKYAMAGEGVCFMYCPPGFAMRPRDTGWFAAFGALCGKGDGSVAYGADGTRFMGATFDPTGLYRQAAVFDWMDEIGLTVGAIHDHVLALQNLFLAAVARAKVRPLADARLVTPIAVGIGRGHFLTFELSGAQALHDRLARANLVTDVLKGPVTYGTAASVFASGWGKWPIAGKTGTAQDNTNVWFAGYTRQVVTAVWVGSQGRPYPLADYWGYDVFGATVAAPIWKAFMLNVLEGYPAKQFPSGKLTTVPNVIGKPIAEARQLIRAAHLQMAAHFVPSYLPAGTVVAQDPSAGAQTVPTLVVSVSVSNGVAPTHTLPDVVGLTSDAASSTLGAIHVFVSVVDQAVKKPSNDGIVLSMDPVGGTKVKEGSSVTLVVGVGPTPPSPSPSPSPSPKPGKGKGNGNGHGGGGGGNAAIAFVTRAAP